MVLITLLFLLCFLGYQDETGDILTSLEKGLSLTSLIEIKCRNKMSDSMESPMVCDFKYLSSARLSASQLKDRVGFFKNIFGQVMS